MDIWKSIFLLAFLGTLGGIASCTVGKEFAPPVQVRNFNWEALKRESQSNERMQCHIEGKKHTPRIEVEPFNSGSWISEKFKGEHCRELSDEGTTLTTQLQAEEGGFDTGITHSTKDNRIDDLHPETAISAQTEIDFVSVADDTWWMVGPKLGAMICQDCSLEDNLSTWYENYVIENASKSPDERHEQCLNSPDKCQYIGETAQDGSTYKHYLWKHKTWKQFYAVRQDYRTGGEVNVALIMKYWRENGHPNHYLNGIKYNFESGGPVSGTLIIKDFKIKNFGVFK